MFRWCTSCERLAGEVDPLEDYRLAFGVCAKCGRALGRPPGLHARALVAQRLFARLMQPGNEPGEAELDGFVREARAARIPPSEVLVGVLQSALYEIGRRWERGEATVVDEHRFTRLCLELYERLKTADRPAGGALIALAMAPGNAHDVGLRILERMAAERGVRCRILPPSTAEEIADAAAKLNPDLLGLSVSMSSLLPAARETVALCRQRAPGVAVTVGGRAARALPEGAFPGATIARRLDDFLDALARLSPGA